MALSVRLAVPCGV